MIDGSEKRKRQLAFELQNSRVYEKCSKYRACLQAFSTTTLRLKLCETVETVFTVSYLSP